MTILKAEVYCTVRYVIWRKAPIHYEIVLKFNVLLIDEGYRA